MMRTLIKQELHKSHIPLMLAVFSSVAIRMVIDAPLRLAGRSLGELSPGFAALYVLFWGMCFFFLIASNVLNRSGRLGLALPIPTRRLWLVRIGSNICTILVPVAIITVITALRLERGAGSLFEPGVIRLGAHTAAGLVLAAFLLNSPSPDLYRIRVGAGYVLYTIVVSLAVLAATLAGIGTGYYALIFTGLSLLLGARIYLSLPPAFSVAPLKPVDRGRLAADGADLGGGEAPARAAAVAEPTSVGPGGKPNGLSTGGPEATPSAFFTHATIMRILFNRWYVWLTWLLLGFYSVMITIAFHDVNKDSPYPFFMVIWIFLIFVYMFNRMPMIEHLPIARRTVFAYAMIPSIIVMLIGFGIGTASVRSSRRADGMIQICGKSMCIPDEFWEVSTNGKPPVLRAPWGEIHAPEAHPLFRGSDIIIYKPFDCNEHSSPRFVALQLDRAAHAIYGGPLDTSRSYDDLDQSFVDAVEHGTFTFGGSVGRGSEARSRTFAAGAIICALAYTVLILLQFRVTRAMKLRPVLDHPIAVAMIAILVIIAAVVAGGRIGFVTPRVVAAVPAILVRKAADAVPLGASALWAVFAAVCACSYLALQTAFERVEAISQTQREFLVDY